MALAVLITGSITYAGLWLGAECVGLWVLRGWVEGTFRFHVAGVDSWFGSSCAQLVVYGLALGAPFPLLRQPGILGPALYLPCAAYSLAINPVMVLIGRYLDVGRQIQVRARRGTAQFRALSLRREKELHTRAYASL